MLHHRPRKRRAATKRWRTVLGALWRRPMRSLGVVGFMGVAAAVLVNALALQAARHPAPLFGESAANANARPKAVIRLNDPPAPPPQLRVALPQARPAERPAVPVEAPVAAPPADPIGDMIRGGATPDPQRVAAAQRALAKLGYGPVQADGVMGAETRLAIERFEKDRKLPASGALTPRVAKALAGAAGMSVE